MGVRGSYEVFYSDSGGWHAADSTRGLMEKNQTGSESGDNGREIEELEHWDDCGKI